MGRRLPQAAPGCPRPPTKGAAPCESPRSGAGVYIEAPRLRKGAADLGRTYAAERRRTEEAPRGSRAEQDAHQRKPTPTTASRRARIDQT